MAAERRRRSAGTSAESEGDARHRNDGFAVGGNGLSENGFHRCAGLQRLANRLEQFRHVITSFPMMA